MITVGGKSCIPIGVDNLRRFLEMLVPADKLPDFVVKLDGREKVKSVFAKLDGSVLTVYTGAVACCGAECFPEVKDARSLLFLFIFYGVKKAGVKQGFEIKSNAQGVSALKSDSDFQVLTNQISLFMDKFDSMFKDVPVVSVDVGQVIKESVPKKQSEKEPKDPGSVFVPLGETPKIEVPEGLDLTAV